MTFMVDEDMVKVLDDTAERLLKSKAKWAELMTGAVVAGCTAGVRLDDATRQAFATFHDAPKYTVKGKGIDAGPKMLISGVPDVEGLASRDVAIFALDLRMCEHCGAVSRKMGACKKCKHATYCSAACQTAAWKAHRPLCNSLVEQGASLAALADGGSTKALLYAPRFLRETLRPDRPRLCKFWLEALVACVHMVAAADAYLPLAALLAYLWKYTWAAFPGFLRASLTSALLALQGRLTADERKDPAGMTAEEGAHTSACRIALLMCDALSWLAKGDDALDAWLRGDGAGKLLPCSQHFRPLMAVDNGRAFRLIVAEALVRQHGVHADVQHANLPPDTACMLQCILPRGMGLVASAFGHKHALHTVKTLLKAWAAAHNTSSGWEAMRDEVVHLYGVGAFETTGTGAVSDERYAAMPKTASAVAGIAVADWRDVAELLSMVQAAGVRALPVTVADVHIVELRDQAALIERLRGKLSTADFDAFLDKVVAAKNALGPVAKDVVAEGQSKLPEVRLADAQLPAP